MTWVRLDDEFTAHPKVSQLTDREFRVHIRTLCWSAKYKTYGNLPPGVFNDVAGLTRQLGRKFVAIGLWDETDTPGILVIHNALKYLPKDETNAQRQREWRERNAMRNGSRNTEHNERGNGEGNGSLRERASRAPGFPEPEPEPEEVVPEEIVKGQAVPTSQNGARVEQPAHQHLVQKLLVLIGPDADEGTEQILNSIVAQLPESAVASVAESVQHERHKRPRTVTDFAAYAVGALQAERGSREA